MATISPLHNLQLDISNRQIMKIALPISLAILVPQFNLITNNIFLGHYNQHALATASITGVYYLIFAMIGFGLNNGLQTLIARRAGENRPGITRPIPSAVNKMLATIGNGPSMMCG